MCFLKETSSIYLWIFFFFSFLFFFFFFVHRLPATVNNRRAPAWLIPESSWCSAWWFRPFCTGSAGWCCSVHGNSMTKPTFREPRSLSKECLAENHGNTRPLHNHASEVAICRWKSTKPLWSFHINRRAIHEKNIYEYLSFQIYESRNSSIFQFSKLLNINKLLSIIKYFKKIIELFLDLFFIEMFKSPQF